MVILLSTADVQWLLETHLKGQTVKPFAIAILDGQESSPTRISLYARDHYECIPTVYTEIDDGSYVLTSEGE